MEKKIVFVFVFITVSFLAMAQSTALTGHNLSLGATLGLLAGRTEEIVYRDNVSKNKMSQLLWDLKPLVYAGMDLRYNYQPALADKVGFFSNLSLKFGIPAKTGVMEDRDWISDYHYDYYYYLDHGDYYSYLYNPDWLTDYSVHDNHTKRAILIDAKVGPSFTIAEKFLLRPYILYSFMNFSWEGTGGSVLHMPDLNGHYPLPSTVTVITYRQTWNIVSPGISFYGEFNRCFDIELFFNISPLIWCTAVDKHFANDPAADEYFTDTMFGGLYLEPGFLFSFKPNTLFSLALSFSYRNMSGTRGDEVFKQYGNSTTYNNVAGAGYSVFDIGIIAKFKLF